MRLPLLMHLTDLALAALATDARVEGQPLDADAMLRRFYDWSVDDCERAIRALAHNLPPTMFELVVADPELPAYLQPPIGGLLARKNKALPRDADCLTPDDLNPIGMRVVHDRHHGSWPSDAEVWALSLIVRETAAPGVGSGMRGALRGNPRSYASVHPLLDPATMFREDIERAIVDRARYEATVGGPDRARLLQRRSSLLWDQPWGRDGFHRPADADPFFVAPAVPIRLIEAGGAIRAVMLQANDMGEKWIARLRNGIGRPPTTRQLRDVWMAVEQGRPTEDDPEPLKPRGHLKKSFAQDVVAAFFAGTDGRSGDLPVTVTLDHDEPMARNGWGQLVLAGFVGDRDTPFREVVNEIAVEPDETDPELYHVARDWLTRLADNNRAFHATAEQLGKTLRRVYADAADGLTADINAAVAAVQRRLDAVFFAELRKGLEARDQGEVWRKLLREAALDALDRFERENPIEEPKAMQRFEKAWRELSDALAKL